jgi:hypothetical protein
MNGPVRAQLRWKAGSRRVEVHICRKTGLQKGGAGRQLYLDAEHQVGALVFRQRDARRELRPGIDGDNPACEEVIVESGEPRQSTLANMKPGQ